MARQRRNSTVSNNSSTLDRGEQELGSMYDYLAKVILLGPSGCGKSCLLHRFVKNEWRVLSSQTIGVEFSSRIVKVGSGARRKRIKLQLWDTAGAVLIYDLASHSTFNSLPTFLNDARALASPNLTLLLAGNKLDLVPDHAPPEDTAEIAASPAKSVTAKSDDDRIGSSHSSTQYGLGTQLTRTIAVEGREVAQSEATSWGSNNGIPVAVEISAFTGEGVEDVFARLASMILTKIELGEIDPDDPMSGIQYGDSMNWDDTGSVKSRGTMMDDGGSTRRRRKGKAAGGKWGSGLREWEQVFKLDPTRRRRGGGCCQ